MGSVYRKFLKEVLLLYSENYNMGGVVKKGGCNTGMNAVKKVIVPTYDVLDSLEDEEYDDEVFYPSEPSGKSKRKIFGKAIKSLSSKSFKIKKNKGGCYKAEKVTTDYENHIAEFSALKSAISLVPGVKNFLVDQLPHALEQVHDNIPVALNLILPIAFKKVLPGVMGNVAGQAVASKITSYIQQKDSTVLSRCIPEDILYDIAVKRSLEDNESSDDKSLDLKRFKFEN